MPPCAVITPPGGESAVSLSQGGLELLRIINTPGDNNATAPTASAAVFRDDGRAVAAVSRHSVVLLPSL